MASGEVSPAPSTSGGRGLKAMLAKARRNNNNNNNTADNASSISLTGTDGSTESHGLRGSLESTLEKIKNAGRKDSESTETSGAGGIAKLISGQRKKREKKKKAKQEAEDGDAQRGRSIGDGEGVTGTGLSSANQSIVDDGDDGDSLMTDDSGEEQ